MDDQRLYEEQQPPGQFSLCVRVREQLPDLLEGYLDAMTAEAIRAHLSVCFLCGRLYDEMEQTIRLVETLPFAEPARDIAPQVMAAIRGQPDYCFQTPVVEMETEGPMRVSWPRTITGEERPRAGGDTWTGVLRSARSLLRRARGGGCPAGRLDVSGRAGTYRVLVGRTGRVVGAEVAVAGSAVARLRGLVGRRLAEGQGLWLRPCNGVHTWFMAGPVDVLVLDRAGTLVAMRKEMGPWRVMLPVRGGYSTIEVGAGAAERAGAQIGDRVVAELLR